MFKHINFLHVSPVSLRNLRVDSFMDVWVRGGSQVISFFMDAWVRTGSSTSILICCSFNLVELQVFEDIETLLLFNQLRLVN